MIKKDNIKFFSENKKIYDMILDKKNYLENFTLEYFKLDDFLKINFKHKDIHILFVPLNFLVKNCNIFTNTLQKNLNINIIICTTKKLGNIFTPYSKNIFFYPLSFSEFQKQINFVKLSNNIIFRNLELNRQINTLINLKNNQSSKLTLIETNIFYILLNSSSPVSKEEINKIALGYNKDINSHSLDSHIYRLRKKLRSISSEIQIISKKTGCYQVE